MSPWLWDTGCPLSANLPTRPDVSGSSSHADSRASATSQVNQVAPAELAATLPPPPPEELAELRPGSTVDGRYRILEKLGEGGMGAVFIAEHLALHKQVALKTIHSNLGGHAEIAARFAREAMVSARIEHPGVVSAMDFGTLESGGAYLVMQLVRGEGLRRRLEREPSLPWTEACSLMEQIADAVAAAHGAGIVHRDLKPENVVLEPSETSGVNVKVLDFGIAHLRSEAPELRTLAPNAPLTQLGVVMGTPGYMAPEQAVGQPVDERADVYALGVMLWEFLAGRQPFSGSSLTEIIAKQFAPSPPPLPDQAQHVPHELSALIHQMLAARPEERPRSALEVRERLRTLRTAGPRARLGGVAPASLFARGRQQFFRLNRQQQTIAGVLSMVLLAGLLYGLFSSPDNTEADGVVPLQASGQTQPERGSSTSSATHAAEGTARPGDDEGLADGTERS
jgi:serine/threonine protein kinase